MSAYPRYWLQYEYQDGEEWHTQRVRAIDEPEARWWKEILERGITRYRNIQIVVEKAPVE